MSIQAPVVESNPIWRCQPPEAQARTPRVRCPPGTTDCHVHVYGPDALYPVAATRAFDVPEALPSTLRTLHDVLGVDRLVLVQPSGYGVNNQRHLDAMAELGRSARMVAALRADVSDVELERMHEAGVRGIRYNIGHPGAVPIAEMPVLARRVVRLGWHVQLHVMDDGGGSPLAEMERTLHGLPADVVIDHLGSLRPQAGLGQAGFQAVLRLLAAGRCWVKLSCGYRMSSLVPPHEDMLPYVQALVSQRPDRLLWASDWPHVAFKGKMPNTTDALDLMMTWVPDELQRNRIFVDNPATLYGF